MIDEQNIIILRACYGKVGQSYILNPTVNKETGMYPSCVKMVDKDGDMVLSDKDKASGKVFIPITEEIEVQDGTTFDLNNPLQAARWEAIKDSSLIAKDRFAHDRNGDLVIDGSSTKYGRAVLYIERPGQFTRIKNNKAKLITKALNFVFSDNTDGQITKCKLIGKNMKNAYPSDIEDYLVEYAKRQPQKIIDLYTGSDTELRMLFIDAVNKGIIREKDGIFMYGDKIAMGVTDEAVISYLKQPANMKIKNYITEETYPEYNETKSSFEEMPKMKNTEKEDDLNKEDLEAEEPIKVEELISSIETVSKKPKKAKNTK